MSTTNDQITETSTRPFSQRELAEFEEREARSYRNHLKATARKYVELRKEIEGIKAERDLKAAEASGLRNDLSFWRYECSLLQAELDAMKAEQADRSC